MRKVLFCFLLLISLGVLAYALSGCDSTSTLPSTTNNFAFVREPGAIGGAQIGKLDRRTWKAARKAGTLHGKARFALSDIEPGDNSIYVMANQGALGSETKVGESGVYGGAFASYDGKKGVFSALTSDGYDQIFIANADGSGVIQLTTDAEDHGEAQLSYDGTQVVFVVFQEGPDNIYVMSSSGGTETLVPTAGLFLDHPTFTPSGKIVFEGWDGETTDSIFIVNQDGSNLTNLTNNPATSNYDETASVSPDGTKLVFSTYTWDSDIEDIYIADFNGTAVSNVTRLTTTGIVANTSWDPMFIADRIVFLSWGNDQYEDIYSMNYDGSGVQRLTSNTDYEWFY